MRKLFALVLALVIVAALCPSAKAGESAEFKPNEIPSVAIKYSQGLGVWFKNGVTPGSVSSKFEVALKWKLNSWFGVGPEFGISTPCTKFNPSLRGKLVVHFQLADKYSFSLGVLYQYTPSYANAPDVHAFGPAIGLSHSLTDHLGIGFSVAVAKVFGDGPWGLQFSPGVAYKF